MTPTDVLQGALAAVEARGPVYGRPRDNHGRTAALWSAYLGIEISARQVCFLNILQKISRDAHRRHFDNIVDIAGYAANAADCEDELTTRPVVLAGPQ